MSNLFRNFDVFLKEEEVDMQNDNTEEMTLNFISKQYLKDQIIQNAESEAELIIEKAKAKTKKIIDDANIRKKEIFEAEKAAGFKKGLKNAEKEIELSYKKSIKRFDEVVDLILCEKENFLNNSENELVQFVLKIVENIFADILEKDKQYIVKMVKNAVCKISHCKEVKIFLSKENYDFITQDIDNIKRDSDINNIQVIVDKSLKNSECMMENEYGYVDVSYIKQIEKIEKELLLLTGANN